MSEYEQVRRNPWPLRIFIALALIVIAIIGASHFGVFKHKDTPAELTARDNYAKWQDRLNDVTAIKDDVARLRIERTILTASHGDNDSSTWPSAEQTKLKKIDGAIIAQSALYNARAKDFNNRWTVENRPFSTDESLPSGLPDGQRRVLRELSLIL